MADELVSHLVDTDTSCQQILLTHGHADHIAGIVELKQRFGEISVAIGTDDAFMLTDAMGNLSGMMGMNLVVDAPQRKLVHGDTVTFGTITFGVLHTPGHTPGGICLYCADQGLVFSGDTLFASGVGRSDFPGGSHATLIDSIRQQLLTLPDSTVVYPGHGPKTTIGQEKKANPFLR